MDKSLKILHEEIETLTSFGKSLLSDNFRKVDQAIEDISHNFYVHNHSHTQFAWKFLTINHVSSSRNLRQVTAEINRKRQALIEAKYNYLEKMNEAKTLQLQLEKINGDDILRESLTIKKERIIHMAQLSLEPIEGAMKDILMLSRIYKDLTKQIGEIDEERLEQLEIDYWIKRSFAQSLRDVREAGYISKGEQELLENIGFNPFFVQKLLLEFAQESRDRVSIESEEIFLQKMSEQYSHICREHLERKGFVIEPLKEALK